MSGSHINTRVLAPVGYLVEIQINGGLCRGGQWVQHFAVCAEASPRSRSVAACAEDPPHHLVEPLLQVGEDALEARGDAGRAVGAAAAIAVEECGGRPCRREPLQWRLPMQRMNNKSNVSFTSMLSEQ